MPSVRAERAPTAGLRGERTFYLTIFVLAAVVVFIGFARTFFLRAYFIDPPLPLLLAVHGTVSAGWVLLGLAQTTLVARRRVDLHRRLGLAGGLLAGAITALGAGAAILSARHRLGTSHEDAALRFLLIPLGDVAFFAAFVGMAFLLRDAAQAHKRLMVLATISILGPAFARFPVAWLQHGGPTGFFAATDAVLLFAIGYDAIARRRVHAVYLWGGSLLVLGQPIRLAVGATGAWLAFARWLVR